MHQIHVMVCVSQTDTLNQRQNNRQISAIGLQLLSSVRTFLGKLFELGNRNRQQLHNDGCVDVGADTHCKIDQLEFAPPAITL